MKLKDIKSQIAILPDDAEVVVDICLADEAESISYVGNTCYLKIRNDFDDFATTEEFSAVEETLEELEDYIEEDFEIA